MSKRGGRAPQLPEFTSQRTCPHCRNLTPHRVAVRYSQVEEHFDERFGPWEAGPVYVVLECPACKNITLVRDHYNSEIDDRDDSAVLYPTAARKRLGLPKMVASAVESAEKVRDADANAFGVLVRRTLELLCQDRKAVGRTLHDKLKDLGEKGEIPAELVKIAFGLKDLGNIGAHATLGELTPKEVPLMNALLDAILEFVYGAPYLVSVVEQRMAAFKKAKSDKKAD